jgi:hypothetical protein
MIISEHYKNIVYSIGGVVVVCVLSVIIMIWQQPKFVMQVVGNDDDTGITKKINWSLVVCYSLLFGILSGIIFMLCMTGILSKGHRKNDRGSMSFNPRYMKDQVYN